MMTISRTLGAKIRFFSSISANILRDLNPLRLLGGALLKTTPEALTSSSMNLSTEKTRWMRRSQDEKLVLLKADRQHQKSTYISWSMQLWNWS